MSCNLEWSCLSRSLPRVTELFLIFKVKWWTQHSQGRKRVIEKFMTSLCLLSFSSSEKMSVFSPFQNFSASFCLSMTSCGCEDFKHSVSHTSKFLLNTQSQSLVRWLHLVCCYLAMWYVISISLLSPVSHRESCQICDWDVILVLLFTISGKFNYDHSDSVDLFPSSFGSWSWKEGVILSRHCNVWLIFSPFVVFLIVLPLRMRDVAVK